PATIQVQGNHAHSAHTTNAPPAKPPHAPPAPTARSSDLSGDDPAQPFKTNLDHHAVDDPKTNFPSNSNNHPLQQPAHNSLHTPAQPHDHNTPPLNSGDHPSTGPVY